MAASTTSPKKGGFPPFAVILLIAAAFIVGIFWNRFTALEKQVAELTGGKVAQGGTGGGAGTPNQPAGSGGTAPAGGSALGSAGQVDPVTDEDHVRGNAQADIMLIEYSDFECPFCQRFHPTMQQVMDEYGDQVAWVYRHFPLTSIHPNAQKAAEASECVAELGGNDVFWEYADKLFSGSGLTAAELTTAAGTVGVNESQVSSCLSGSKYAQKVNDHLASGQKAGVTGTPGTVILKVSTGETQLIPGALPFAQIKSAIDALL